MDGHFRAFSFVDRITSIDRGVRIRGAYQVPAQIPSFVTPLVAEAVGQLAAWCAMDAVDFKVRPVAGIAAKVELLSTVRPGQTLELAADLDSVDLEAVSYSGVAHVAGVPVVRLTHCVGPMVPQGDFDDLDAVKQRFALLSGTGAKPGVFGGIPDFDFTNVVREPGQWIRADLLVPSVAPLFDDHFARKPVFPGTLFMQKVLELGGRLAHDMPILDHDRCWTARVISDGKLRKFIPPGDSLAFEARFAKREKDSLVIAVEARQSNRVTGHAKILYSLGEKK